MKPMLSGEAILGQVSYPKLASFKLNGVRGLIKEKVYARSLKPIPNEHTQSLLSHPGLLNLDGELMVKNPKTGLYVDVVGQPPCIFSMSTSAVMSPDGVPDVALFVFDTFRSPSDPFSKRTEEAEQKVRSLQGTGLNGSVFYCPQILIRSDSELVELGKYAVNDGYEGLVLRDPNAKYKFGRSTDLEGSFLRWTPWLYSEARILKLNQGMSNQNVGVTNELGRTQRSTAQAGKVPRDACGSVDCVDVHSGITFSCGLKDPEDEIYFWKNPSLVLGKVIKYRFKAPTKEKPRFPQMEGFRDPIDMS